MIYQGKAITVKPLEGGIVELNFDLKGESVNKFNRLTLSELRAAVDAIKADASVKGVIASTAARNSLRVRRLNLLTDSPLRSKFNSTMPPSRGLTVMALPW